jgi:acetyl esterase/lipase
MGAVESWASFANVIPTRIPGYWLDKPGCDIPVGQKPVAGEKVLYCLHGGGYVEFSAHPKDKIAFVPIGILEHCKHFKRAFSIEYRLSSTAPLASANPFPAALIDALAGYNYLVNNVGFDPSDIVIEGDSAGGNLALALTRYLVEYSDQTKLPRSPSSVILLSPWADIGSSHDGPNSSLTTCSMDFLPDLNSDRIVWMKHAFVGPHKMDAAETNHYISPASLGVSSDFKGFPRTFIVAGGAERLRDSIVTLKDIMVADMGEGDGKGQVTYYEAPDAVHDYLVFPWHEPERTTTIQAMSKWL